jgi:iron complex outermembrane receptor protein
MLKSRIRLSFLLLLTSLGAVSESVAQADENAEALEVVIVTATRTNTDRNTMAQGVTVLDGDSIARSDLQHSNQLFNRVSGAWISRGNGQESLVSLRSPVLTGAGACGAFLTAEDGIALRAPGFCNVNQLFDANLIQAGSVEVLKGPAIACSVALRGIQIIQCE